MELLKHLNYSISVTQAWVALCASLLIGSVLSVLYLGYYLGQQYRDTTVLAQQVLVTVKSQAAGLIQVSDPASANSFVAKLAALDIIAAATLADGQGKAFTHGVHGESTQAQFYPFLHWAITRFLGDLQLQTTLESAAAMQAGNSVGVLSLQVALEPIASSVVHLSVLLLCAVIMLALCMGLILFYRSSRLIKQPLHRAAGVIAAIDAQQPDTTHLKALPGYARGDLGCLLQATEQLLTQLANTQAQLRNSATRDPLTKQPNRTLITDRLARALANARRNNTLVAVLFLDLDRFKNINDSLGHDVGDLLLVEVARRLTDILRSNDSVGRLGGDEFLIVIENAQGVDEALSTVRRVTYSLAAPFTLEDHEIRTSASIGIAVFPDDGEDTGTLMRCADLAMYEAKGTGVGWHFFAKTMSERVEMRLQTEAALGRALEQGELDLHFQAKVDTRSGDLAGCEALLRWHGNAESLAAEDIISIAEQSGIIVEIGTWVLSRACEQIRDWQQRFGAIPIAVNVSARQLKEPDFVDSVLGIMQEYGVDPALMEFEITETVLLEALDHSFTVLKELRNAGITISIDDFGTGYSSLSYLTRLPVDTLKIDRSFISGSQRSKAVLEMIVAMAKTLQLKTVAEGVETAGQRDWLAFEGCDYLQGYLIGKPLDAEAFAAQFLTVRGSA
ncbi:MAG: EAL domain-containing protein [Cellvibrionaceae bacterium]|nr:EAL domain-containing protein [Cellvibrionaceae bacterium]